MKQAQPEPHLGERRLNDPEMLPVQAELTGDVRVARVKSLKS